jgi:hexosaminidase
MPSKDIPSIIPLPRHYQRDEGMFHYKPSLSIACPLSGDTTSGVPAVLANWLKARRPETTFNMVSGNKAHIRFEIGEGMPQEAYQLEITTEGITITGNQTGWVRGAASLVMMLQEKGWAACRVEDQPRFTWRGMHLDVCRHFFPIPQVKRFIDLIALHRMNTFHWHLTDDQGWRIAIDAFPRLAEISAWRDRDGQAYGGFYSAQDIQEVLRYAEERCIQVIPEIEMPGHARAALAAFPDISCTGGPFDVPNTCGIFDDVYCAGKESTFKFLENVLEEVCRLFPAPSLHLGGDECPKRRWEECPDCQDRMRRENLKDTNELQSWFITRMGRTLQSMGKHMIGWDEILEGGLPPSAVVMSWQGVKGGIEAANLGHEVIMSPTSHCYFDYRQSEEPEEPGNLGRIPLQDVYEYEPVPPELDTRAASRILGLQGNVWTERMPTWKLVEYMILPRLCALSEVAWSPASTKDWEHFQSRVLPHLQCLREMGYTFRHPQRSQREFPL